MNKKVLLIGGIVVVLCVTVAVLANSSNKEYSNYVDTLEPGNDGDNTDFEHGDLMTVYFSNNQEFIDSVIPADLDLFISAIPSDILSQYNSLTFVSIDNDGTIHAEYDGGIVEFRKAYGTYVITTY